MLLPLILAGSRRGCGVAIVAALGVHPAGCRRAVGRSGGRGPQRDAQSPHDAPDRAVPDIRIRTRARCRRRSGRAAVGVLLARPRTTAMGVDIYSGYWGIDENTPARFMRNAQIAGVAARAAARVGDMRQLPFGDGEFDAVVSSNAIDHLPRAERPKRLPKSRGSSSRAASPAHDHPSTGGHGSSPPCSPTIPRRIQNRGAHCCGKADSHWRRKAHRSRHFIFLRRSRAPGRRR